MAIHRSSVSYRGPTCPEDPAHGSLYSWPDARWFCPHEGHGGNGKIFTHEQGGELVVVQKKETHTMAKNETITPAPKPSQKGKAQAKPRTRKVAPAVAPVVVQEAQKPTRGSRVGGERFAAIRDLQGVKNADIAREMGWSSTRAHRVTKEGASPETFARYAKAVETVALLKRGTMPNPPTEAEAQAQLAGS